jgi:hypothetical protein
MELIFISGPGLPKESNIHSDHHLNFKYGCRQEGKVGTCLPTRVFKRIKVKKINIPHIKDEYSHFYAIGELTNGRFWATDRQHAYNNRRIEECHLLECGTV